MTTLTIPHDVLSRMRSAAEAVTGHLTAETAWSVDADGIPQEITGGRAVVAPLGTDGRLALIITPAFARRLIVGPPPADSLEDALAPAFSAAAVALAGSSDSGFDLGELAESTMTEAVATADGSISAFRLLDGEQHVATFVVAASFDVTETPEVEAPVFEQIPEGPSPTAHHPVSMLADVEMGVTVELGRARMSVAEILSLTIGSVVELDRLAGSPVDVLVNGTLIARGEVVVIDEEFGVRVSEVLGYEPTDRNRR